MNFGQIFLGRWTAQLTMNTQAFFTKNANERVFDRIKVDGSINIAGKNCKINDLSVGGLSAQYFDNSSNSVTRLKLLEVSEVFI